MAKTALHKIVVDAKIPFIRGIFEPFAKVVYREGSQISRSDAEDADALIVRTRTTCDATLLAGTKVRFIATATIGFDHIDAEFCRNHGITWTSAPGCNSASVQQYLASALVHCSEKLHFRFAGTTIGIVGVGNVGNKVARMCELFGMRVLLNDPPRERKEGRSGFVPLSEITAQADIVTFHVPLNDGGPDNTHHLADAAFIAGLRKRPILINTSRGEVADTAALKAAIVDKRVAGCVLDVWEGEPEIDKDLLSSVDIGTPHIAGYSADGKANGTAMSVQAISRFFQLGLDEWVPPVVPVPPSTTIELNAARLTTEDVLHRLIRATYDIREDDRRLRESPQTFEKQRGEYPLRREFPVYSVRMPHASDAARMLAAQMGFQLLH